MVHFAPNQDDRAGQVRRFVHKCVKFEELTKAVQAWLYGNDFLKDKAFARTHGASNAPGQRQVSPGKRHLASLRRGEKVNLLTTCKCHHRDEFVVFFSVTITLMKWIGAEALPSGLTCHYTKAAEDGRVRRRKANSLRS